MTELDFDELDKAVNSLMVDSPEQTPPPQPATPEVPAAAEATTPATTAPESRLAPTAIKRRGQFMDVMHPSADMKNTASRSAQPVARVSRQGVTLAPPTPETAPEPAVAPPVESPVAAAAPEPSKVEIPPVPEWPDPLDIVESESATPEPAPVVAIEPISPAPVEPTLEPLSSPFLPDAKVEKRPLGEAQPTGPIDEPEAPTMPDQPDAPLPAELSGGVLAVESNDLTTTEKPMEPAVPEELTAQKTDAPEPEPTPEKPAGPTSIPPQYKADDGSQEPAEHSALYDAVSAGQAAVTTKKKNGWLIPVAIIGLIILGCGGGVLVYYYLL